MDLISVIVVSYNSANTIIETLESIKLQTYPNIQIVISDDGSIDNTVEIAENWSKSNQVNYIIVKSDKNTGISANCNRGIQNAEGKYFKIIAADDRLVPQAISVFYSFLCDSKNKKIIYQSKLITFGASNEDVNKYLNASYIKFSASGNQFDLLLKQDFLSAPAMGLFDREGMLSIGGFDERFKMMEDYPFYLKLSDAGYIFRLIDEELVYYRLGDQSVRVKANYLYNKTCFEFFWKQMIRYLVKEKMFYEIARQGYQISLRYIKSYIKKAILR